MISYPKDMTAEALDAWPFDNPDSAYRIVSGDPQASGRLDAGGAGAVTRTGLWRCTVGVFECTEQGDELMTVLTGRCCVTDLRTGQASRLGPGDTAFLRDGSRVRWEIFEEVTKVFYGYRPEGF